MNTLPNIQNIIIKKIVNTVGVFGTMSVAIILYKYIQKHKLQSNININIVDKINRCYNIIVNNFNKFKLQFMNNKDKIYKIAIIIMIIVLYVFKKPIINFCLIL